MSFPHCSDHPYRLARNEVAPAVPASRLRKHPVKQSSLFDSWRHILRVGDPGWILSWFLLCSTSRSGSVRRETRNGPPSLPFSVHEHGPDWLAHIWSVLFFFLVILLGGTPTTITGLARPHHPAPTTHELATMYRDAIGFSVPSFTALSTDRRLSTGREGMERATVRRRLDLEWSQTQLVHHPFFPPT